MIRCEISNCPISLGRTAITAKLFKSLGDPTRLTILQALRRRPMRVVDLTDLTGRAQPNVSAHLACLRDCGLVRAEPAGRETFYCLTEGLIEVILDNATGIVGHIEPQLCQCTCFPGDEDEQAS